MGQIRTDNIAREAGRDTKNCLSDRLTAAYKDTGGAGRYDDIIDHARHVSKVHPQMPVSERAAQFAPFAALSGHEDVIRETQRQVEERIEHEYD